MPPIYIGGFFMIVRKNREEVSTSWNIQARERYKTKSRKYMLGSFFTTILTAITDPKDGNALGIKCDPAYLADSDYKNRTEAETTYKVRFRS